MFGIAATALEWVVGKGFLMVGLPAIVLGVLHMGGSVVEARRNELRAQGAKICQQTWELHLSNQQRDAAIAQVAVAERSRQLTEAAKEELKRNVDAMEAELRSYRDAAATADERCLSDSVRQLATGSGASRPAAGNDAGAGGGESRSERRRGGSSSKAGSPTPAP